MKPLVLLVGGGSGKRMGSDLPKQFLEVKGKPIWTYTVDKFLLWNADCEFVIVLPPDFILYFQAQAQKFFPQHSFKVCAGGKERTDSVRNGLSQFVQNENSFVWIHDLVRPLVSIKTLDSSLQVAQGKGNAVVAVPVKSSLRKITETGSIAVDRSLFMEVQTPQVFKLSELLNAYTATNQLFTDDASLMEQAGYQIFLSEGNYENIKITTPEDLLIMERILDQA